MGEAVDSRGAAREQNWERTLAGALRWLAAAALALAGLFPGNNPDTFGHLAQGRQIVELGYVPPVDTWSLLPGPPRPWHNYEWLSDLLFYGLYRGFGYDGLLGFKCALLLVTAWVLLSFARRLGGERAVLLGGLSIIAAIPVVRVRLSDRPHVLGLCLAAFYLVLLSRLVDTPASAPARRRWWPVAALFGLHILWVNIHGSHLLGIAITSAFAVLSPLGNRGLLWSTLALQALASCISPYGPAILFDALEHVLDPRYRHLITEWSPWAEDDPPWMQLGPAIHGALLTLVAPKLVRVSASARATLALALLLGIASFRSIRFVAEFLLLTSPLLGAGYAQLLARANAKRFLAGCSVALAALCFLVPWGAAAMPPFDPIGHGISYADRPHGPGMLLNTSKRAPRVFASIELSWYLMWEAPRARFFMDGRVPFYGPEHMQRAVMAYTDPSVLEQILREDQIDSVVLRHTMRRDHELIPSFQHRSGWSLALVDDAFAVFARDDLSRAANFPRFEVLHPGLEPEWILGADDARRAQITQELRELERFPTADGYRHWALVLLELAPLARPGKLAGFRWPRDAADMQRYRRVSALMARAAPGVGDVPLFGSLRAVVEATLCHFEAAEEALARATREVAPGREAVLASLEIALRRGQREQVVSFVEAARSLPEGRDDAWLAQLEQGLAHPPSCPAP
jgi:hypothetical protein